MNPAGFLSFIFLFPFPSFPLCGFKSEPFHAAMRHVALDGLSSSDLPSTHSHSRFDNLQRVRDISYGRCSSASRSLNGRVNKVSTKYRQSIPYLVADWRCSTRRNEILFVVFVVLWSFLPRGLYQAYSQGSLAF
ncbi:hypothetical protein F5X99DRAFT_381183 [Biscogniauxia marginata]|nr:hypothetical protein F5X99DRAFT_381183 [Biscogniauxia marginata]